MKKYEITIIICILIVVGAAYLLVNTNNSSASFINFTNAINSTNSISTIIGSNSNGYVTKDVYASPGLHQVKIAIITGIHPREKLAIDPVKTLIKNYTLSHNVEIINYAINVQDHPESYTIGRNNGEKLAAKYIVLDIKNSNPDLVIICHAHQWSYGSGFFITTPKMDKESVVLAENVRKVIPSFKYYKASSDSRSNSTSAIRVSDPIAAAGYPVFVYEIPEWASAGEATNMTYKLINTSFNLLNANKGNQIHQ